MQIVEAVRQWWRVRSYLRKPEALGSAATTGLARDNAVAEPDFRRLASRSDSDSSLLRQLLERLGFDYEQLTRCQAGTVRDMGLICAGCAMAPLPERPRTAIRSHAPRTVLPEHGDRRGLTPRLRSDIKTERALNTADPAAVHARV